MIGKDRSSLSGPFAANGHVVLRLEHTGPSETKRPRPLKPWHLFGSNVLLVLQTRHVTEQFPAKTGEYPSTSEYAFRIFKSRVHEKYLKPPFEFKICSILVLGHYLFLEAHSLPWAELLAFWQQMGDFVYNMVFVDVFRGLFLTQKFARLVTLPLRSISLVAGQGKQYHTLERMVWQMFYCLFEWLTCYWPLLTDFGICYYLFCDKRHLSIFTIFYCWHYCLNKGLQ